MTVDRSHIAVYATQWNPLSQDDWWVDGSWNTWHWTMDEACRSDEARYPIRGWLATISYQYSLSRGNNATPYFALTNPLHQSFSFIFWTNTSLYQIGSLRFKKRQIFRYFTGICSQKQWWYEVHIQPYVPRNLRNITYIFLSNIFVFELYRKIRFPPFQ